VENKNPYTSKCVFTFRRFRRYLKPQLIISNWRGKRYARFLATIK
jgi:hypothetical protein